MIHEKNPPINILIVDDEPKNLTVLESILDAPDYRLVRAESAEQALLALMVEEFALLILDIRMPEMSGLELAQMIKDRKKTSKVPIIFLTAYYNEDQHVLSGYDTGAVDYLHKPVNPNILKSKVAVFAELHRFRLECSMVNRELLAEVAERRLKEEQLKELNETLEQRVIERSEELSKSNRRFLRAAEAAKALIYEMDLNSNENVVIDGLKRVVGLDSDAATLSNDWWQDQIHQDDISDYRVQLEQVKASGERYTFSYRLKHANGNWITVEDFGQLIRNAAGEPMSLNGSIMDITERRRIELELRDSDRRKDEFLAILAHELRNPLSPIAMATELLKECGDDKQQMRDLTDVAERHLKQLIRLVDDLLDVSRISRGNIELRSSLCALQDILSIAVEAVEPTMLESQHTLTIDVSAKPIHLQGDSARLNQIITNLLNNAAKYTPTGGHITLSAVEENGFVKVDVRDNGIGIPTERHSDVFELFTQIEAKQSSVNMGLGVGLALAKQLVELHHGKIDIFSEGRDRGTVVSIWLPTVQVDTQEVIDLKADHEEPKRHWTSRRVLIVDDLKSIRFTFTKIMERMGHEVKAAEDGVMALDIIESYRPEVVFSDISMPGMDGYELAARIRERFGKKIHLVAMTGFGTLSDRTRSLDLGFDHHMVKPPDMATLEAFFSEL